MSWFWPFRKNTEPPALVGSLTAGITPKPLATPKPVVEVSSDPVVDLPEANVVPVSLKRSCAFAACGVPNVFCVPVSLLSCLPCRPVCSLKKSELLASPPLEIRSVASPEPVTASVSASESEASAASVAPVKETPTQASSPAAPQSLPQAPSAQ